MVLRSILISLLALSLVSCATTDEKRQAAVIMPDFSKAQPVKPLAPPPPPIIAKPVIENDPLENVYVSVDAVEQNLSAVLYMIAAESGLNLIIGPEVNVSKPFTLTVKNMPARDALDSVCENAGVAYTITGSTLKISAYIAKTYKIPYTTVTADQTSTIGGNIFGSDSTSTELSGDYKITYSKQGILANMQANVLAAVYGMIFPDIVDENGQPQSDSGGSSQQNGNTQPTSGGTDKSGSKSKTDSSASSSATNQTKLSYYRGLRGYSFNTLTGLLRVYAPPHVVHMIDEYIEQTVKDASKQVLIEAKIMEVVLTDSSAYGINWTSENGRYGVTLIGDIIGSQTPVGVVQSYNNLFEFIATQGRIESLGNPRIRVLNGQSAMITSGQLNPFWEKKVDNDTEEDTQTITYERSTVLDGITLGVTANVMDDNRITLHVVPILSSIEDVEYQYELDDQGNSYAVASYPKVNMKEAGTVLTVQNGTTIVMGGLITNKDVVSERRIPILADIPGLGMLFKARSVEKEKRELVILITTTLIDG